MKLPFWVRRTHKWIGLIVGVQALLWMISGVYMTVISLDTIHGDHLMHIARAPLQRSDVRMELDKLQSLYPGIQSFRLKSLLGQDVFEIRRGEKSSLVDAQTGEIISPLKRDAIEALAKEIYQGDAQIRDVSLIAEAPPEVAKRPVPMWAVRYDGWAETTLYFSPNTGELLARRHTLWRWFDFLWMLHIMDYGNRTDVNNTLLRAAAGIGLIFALSGAWLVFYAFRGRRAA